MRRFLVPSVRQPSSTHSAAAALAAALTGYGLTANTEELFVASGGSTSGINIDRLDRVANERGLISEQIMIPLEHLLLPGADTIPSIVLLNSQASNLFCGVVWQHLFGMVQLLDPAHGRRWLFERTLLSRVYRHSQFVAAGELDAWFRTREFQVPLSIRISKLGISDARTLIANAACEPGWKGFACLDAAVRQITRQTIGHRSGRAKSLWTTVVRLWKDSLKSPQNIPKRFWFAPVPNADILSDPASVEVRGAIMLRLRRRRS